ncbi:hypothetical protein RJI07_04700 [Mycoplasmatota bacterium WC30]
MNRTITLSAILISLSIIFVGLMLTLSNPEAEEFLVNVSGLLLILIIPCYIWVLFELLKPRIKEENIKNIE